MPTPLCPDIFLLNDGGLGINEKSIFVDTALLDLFQKPWQMNRHARAEK